MAVLMPTTNFSATASTSRTSSYGIQCTATSLVHLKSSQRISSSRRGRHGSADVFSGARVLCTGIPVRSDYVGTRIGFFSDIGKQSSADEICSSASDLGCTGLAGWFSTCRELPSGSSPLHGHTSTMRSVFGCNCTSPETQATVDNEGVIAMNSQPVEYGTDSTKGANDDSPSGGVAIAVKILQFYKREISPLLPGSCRFVPTCSEYGMQAFRKYGVVKGAILTAWRLSRCNPLGGSGFDPPRWFDEPKPPPY